MLFNSRRGLSFSFVNRQLKLNTDVAFVSESSKEVNGMIELDWIISKFSSSVMI